MKPITKTKPVKDPGWLSLLRKLPCIACGKNPAGYAHHTTSRKGYGQKNGDNMAIPLCYDCHQGPHGIHLDKKAFHATHGTDLELLQATSAMVANYHGDEAVKYEWREHAD